MGRVTRMLKLIIALLASSQQIQSLLSLGIITNMEISHPIRLVDLTVLGCSRSRKFSEGEYA
jgi:hypothetical protein